MKSRQETNASTDLTAQERDLLHWLLVYNDLELAAKTSGYSDEQVMSGEVERLVQGLTFQRVFRQRRNNRRKALEIDEGWMYEKLVQEVNKGTNKSVEALKLMAMMKGFLIEKREIRNVPELDMQKLYKMNDEELVMHLVGALQNMLPEDKRVVIQSTSPTREQLQCIVQEDEEPYYAGDVGSDEEESEETPS
jgi:hypothetical protein